MMKRRYLVDSDDETETVPEPRILIKTERSFLSVIPFSDDVLIQRCVAEIDDKLLVKPPITIYGKVVHQARSVGFFSNVSEGYRYSNQLAKSIPLTEGLVELLAKVCKMYKADFNGILINRYESGDEYISAHSDDEKSLSNVGVVAISFGSVRKFRIRNKSTKEIVKDIPTNSGEIIHMGGDFQKEFTHEIPREAGITKPRYSFTFRRHLK